MIFIPPLPTLLFFEFFPTPFFFCSSFHFNFPLLSFSFSSLSSRFGISVHLFLNIYTSESISKAFWEIIGFQISALSTLRAEKCRVGIFFTVRENSDSRKIPVLEKIPYRKRPGVGPYLCQTHDLIHYIDTNAKCRYLKKFTYKGTLRQVFICLRPPPLLWPHTPPHTVFAYTVYLFTRGRGGGGRANKREG